MVAEYNGRATFLRLNNGMQPGSKLGWREERKEKRGERELKTEERKTDQNYSNLNLVNGVSDRYVQTPKHLS